MNLGRINLALLVLGSIHFVVTGEGDLRMLLMALALAMCLGLLDHSLQRSTQTATIEKEQVAAEPDKPDERQR